MCYCSNLVDCSDTVDGAIPHKDPVVHAICGRNHPHLTLFQVQISTGSSLALAGNTFLGLVNLHTASGQNGNDETINIDSALQFGSVGTSPT